DCHDNRRAAKDAEQPGRALLSAVCAQPASDLTAHRTQFGTAEHLAFIVSAFLDARANLADVFLLPNPLPRIGFAVKCIHDTPLPALLSPLEIARWVFLPRQDPVCAPHLLPSWRRIPL